MVKCIALLVDVGVSLLRGYFIWLKTPHIIQLRWVWLIQGGVGYMYINSCFLDPDLQKSTKYQKKQSLKHIRKFSC